MEKGVIILTLLYIYQGLSLGLAAGGIQILFAHDNRIGIFSLCALSFTLKFLWSPILDYYFIEKIGKRKTYIIPLHLILGLLYLFLSFQDLNNLDTLFYFFIAIMLCVATSDTATDGWQVTLLENVGLGSVCQFFGQSIGWFISQYCFVLLHSLEHLELKTYLQIMSILGFVLAVVVAFVTETNPIVEVVYESFLDEVKQIKGLYQNPNLRTFCIIMLLKRIGMGVMDSLAPIMLIRLGLKKVQLSQIGIVVFASTFWLPILVGNYVTGHKLENKTAMHSLAYQTINMAFFAFSVYEFTKGRDTNLFIYLIGFHLLIHEALKKVFYTSVFAFVVEISEAQLAGMQISFLGSISNFSRVLMDPLLISLSSYVSFYIMILGGFIYQGMFLMKYSDKYQLMQNYPKESWSLHSTQHQEIMRKQIQILARQFCTSNKDINEQQLKKLNITTQTFEFEPFKFGMERSAMIHGYTMEEMYGRYYGLKHSPMMKRELGKDNVVICMIFGLGSLLLGYYYTWSVEDEQFWLKYYYADMPTVRNNLK